MATKRPFLGAVLAVITLLGCGDDPAGPKGGLVPEGRWAGGDANDPVNFLILTTSPTNARFTDNAACTFGVIPEPLRVDAEGRFSAQAQIMRMVPEPQTARVDGVLNGNVITMRLTLDGWARDYRLVLNAPIPPPRYVC